MSKRAWYRSLYWRIGAGFVLFLAVIAAAQAGALVWLTSRVEYGPPSPSATRVLADELSQVLTDNPKTDIGQFFKQHYEERTPMVAVGVRMATWSPFSLPVTKRAMPRLTLATRRPLPDGS